MPLDHEMAMKTQELALYSKPADPSQPVFPTDLERVILEVLLKDTREMCGTMSLVASRFHTWARPFIFGTVILRRRNDWMERIREWILPNASLIHILVLNLPFNHGPRRREFPEEELLSVQRLLEAAKGVKHLAVTWNIWAYLERDCGGLELESLFLVWDGAVAQDMRAPTLEQLQHPEALEDLVVSAPGDLESDGKFRRRGNLYFPATRATTNLAYATYVARRNTIPVVMARKAAMAVRVGLVEAHREEDEEDGSPIRRHKDRHRNFSTAYVGTWGEVLTAWVAKMEGRESFLKHPVVTE
ncbi:hypothetical protein C8R46DRAFT_1237333 [Mycena filopes]|nr:hypothetical protein C8R46DRAFT_1237333 [Mycena filopes]